MSVPIGTEPASGFGRRPSTSHEPALGQWSLRLRLALSISAIRVIGDKGLATYGEAVASNVFII